MEDRIRRIYEMILRVLVFMTANAADFADIPFIAPTVTALQAEADELTDLGAAKLSKTAAAKDSTIVRGDARDDVRDDLEYLAEVWRSMPDETGGMENKFRIPRGNNDQNLIATARSHADEAEEPAVAALLTAHGVKPAFIAALRAKADVFEQTISSSESKQGARVGTNAAFEKPTRNGKKLVDKLNPAVKRVYQDNPQKLAEWLVASHVEKPPKRDKKEEPNPEPDNPNAGTGET